MPGETSHGLLPTYLVWNKDQGDVVPLKGKENLTRYKGRHTTRELDSSLGVIMHHCPMLWFLSYLHNSKLILTRKNKHASINQNKANIHIAHTISSQVRLKQRVSMPRQVICTRVVLALNPDIESQDEADER